MTLTFFSLVRFSIFLSPSHSQYSCFTTLLWCPHLLCCFIPHVFAHAALSSMPLMPSLYTQYLSKCSPIFAAFTHLSRYNDLVPLCPYSMLLTSVIKANDTFLFLRFSSTSTPTRIQDKTFIFIFSFSQGQCL